MAPLGGRVTSGRGEEETEADRPDESDIGGEYGDSWRCRRGLSADPPFCDASHEAAGEDGER